MIQLNTNPIEGSALRLSLSFRDAMGTYFVPLSIEYTLLALNLDKESWSVVGDIYQKPLKPESMVSLVIPDMRMITGTTPKRKLLVTYLAVVDGQETSFVDEACFEVRPMPYVPDKPVPPPTPPVYVSITDVTFQTGSAASSPLTPVFYCRTNMPASIAGATAYITGDTLSDPLQCDMSIDSTCTTITVTCMTELRHASRYILNVDGLESLSGGHPMESPFTLAFVTEKGIDPSQLVKEVTLTENGEHVIDPDEGYSSMNKVLATVAVPLTSDKEVTVTENGTIEIVPDDGDAGMEKVTLTTSIPIQQLRTAEYDRSGDYEIEPEEGYTSMKKVAVRVDVQASLQDMGRLTARENGSYEILPEEGKAGMKKAQVFVDVPLQDKGVTISHNGTTTINPDENYEGMESVTVTTAVPLQNRNITAEHNGTTRIEPEQGYDGMTGVDLTVAVPLQQRKNVTISHNGSTVVTPDQGYDGMQSTGVEVAVPLQNVKNVTVSSNGVSTITPDEGYDGMESVALEVALPLQQSSSITMTENNSSVTVLPSPGNVAMEAVTVNTALPMQDKTTTLSHNGTYTVTPDQEYQGMDSAIVTVDVPLQTNKNASFDTNGIFTVTPDEGFDGIRETTVVVDVPYVTAIEDEKQVSITSSGVIDVYPSDGYDAMRKVVVSTEMTPVAMFAYMGDDNNIYWFASPLGLSARYTMLPDPAVFNDGFVTVAITAASGQFSMTFHSEEIWLTRDSANDILREEPQVTVRP